MRRKDREIVDNVKINEIISSCHCCRLVFFNNGKIYIVPLNFGFEIKDNKRIFYFHGDTKGKKIDLINQNHYAGFELDTNYKLKKANTACQYSASFQSIIGDGNITFIEKIEEKKHALQCIMYHNTNQHFDFSDEMINKVTVFKLEVETISCKYHE